MTRSRWGELNGLRIAVAFIGLALAAGCSSTTKFKLRDGSTVRGRIVRSDATSVWVASDGDAEELPREDIVDVSHPGLGAMITGGSLLVTGAAVAGVAASCKNEVEPGTGYMGSDRPMFDCWVGPALIAGVLGVVGLGVGSSGMERYFESERRFAAPEGRKPRPELRRPTPPPADVDLAEPPPLAPQATPKRSPWCELRACSMP